MEWLGSAAIGPAMEQVHSATTSFVPTNPSSLTLAVIGVSTLVIFEMGRRVLVRRAALGRRGDAARTSEERRRAA